MRAIYIKYNSRFWVGLDVATEWQVAARKAPFAATKSEEIEKSTAAKLLLLTQLGRTFG